MVVSSVLQKRQSTFSTHLPWWRLTRSANILVACLLPHHSRTLPNFTLRGEVMSMQYGYGTKLSYIFSITFAYYTDCTYATDTFCRKIQEGKDTCYFRCTNRHSYIGCSPLQTQEINEVTIKIFDRGRGGGGEEQYLISSGFHLWHVEGIFYIYVNLLKLSSIGEICTE